MKSPAEFKNSLTSDNPDKDLPVQLKSLWYDAKGNWHLAHSLINHLSDRGSAWVHAYLHRKEGDLWNADYWYRKAEQNRPDIPLEVEWEQLVIHFLNG